MRGGGEEGGGHAYSRVVLVVDCMGPVDVALPLIGCLISSCLPVQRLLVVS